MKTPYWLPGALVVLAILLLIFLTACGGGSDGTDENGRCVVNGEVVSMTPCTDKTIGTPVTPGSGGSL